MGKIYPIIVLEGLSGTGKTTVGKIMASKTGGYYFHCKENNPLETFKNFFDKTPIIISFLYYLFYFSFSLIRAKNFAKSSVVYMEKSATWIYAHYKSKGLPARFFKMIPNYLSNEIYLILYFTLNQKERSRRIKRRIKAGKASPNDIKSLTIGDKTDLYYREFLPDKLIEIQTNNKDPEAVANYTLKKLKEIGILKTS